jgi:hypothetical protein
VADSKKLPAARELLNNGSMRGTMALWMVAAVVAVAGARPASAESARRAGVFVTLAQVTNEAERASQIDVIRKRLGECSQLANKVIDVNVTRLSYVTVGTTVELQLELGFVLSTPSNEIVSMVNQTAKLVIPASRFKLDKLPALRREVIDSALGDLIVKLRRAAARNV